jgi:hypothetical protein
MRYVVLLTLLAGCDNSPRSSSSGSGQGAPSGLPQGETPSAQAPSPSGAMPSADPHAGLDMGGVNPHGGDPHGGSLEENPHGGDPHAMTGGPPPSFDPKMVIDGTIDVHAKLKDKVKPGDIMFVSVKSVDAAGTPQRIPIAVDRVDVGTLPAAFSLSGKNTMMPGTKFEGNVMVSVRIDRDGEATTRVKGDIEGTARVTIPARGVKIVLDTPVP